MIVRRFALAAVLAFSAAAFAAGDLASRTSSQAGVAVKVTPRKVSGPQWEFSVVLDTHSQELTDDLMKSAVLAVDGGAPLSPAAWKGDGPGGHHRKAVVSFKAPAGSPASVELRLQRQGEPAPRVFRWQLR
jgi:hypothetical protein